METAKKRVLILGAKGMLWNACYAYLLQNHLFDVFGTSSQAEEGYITLKVDENVSSRLESIFQERSYDLVINCIGSIRPDAGDVYDTFYVNSYFPKILDIFAKRNIFKFIHFSTDCIFDGKKGNYGMLDIPNETSIYGMSKFLGETDSPNSLTLRTSIIWIETVENSRNLLSWFLSQDNNSEISGYSQVLWNGTTTLVIAKIIERIITQDMHLSGVIQIWSEEISKYELLKLFKKVFSRGMNISKNDSIVSNKVIIPSPKQELFSDIFVPLEQQIIDLKELYS